MREETRLKLKQRKNYLPSALLAVMLWILVGGMVGWVDPEIIANVPPRGTYWLFLMLVFGAVFFTLALVLRNSRRGLLLSVGLVVFLFLRLNGLGHIVNGLLLLGLIIITETYFSLK